MTIGVARRAQRRGLGRVLLHALLDRAVADGASAVLLEVAVDNEPALTLYRSEGFEVLARRRRYYQPEDVDAWTMRLSAAAAGRLTVAGPTPVRPRVRRRRTPAAGRAGGRRARRRGSRR